MRNNRLTNGINKKRMVSACIDTEDNNLSKEEAMKEITRKVEVACFVFENEFSADTADGFINLIEEKDADIVDVYFTSPGGAAFALNIMTDYMDRCGRFFNITIAEQICSAGLAFFLRACEMENCRVQLLSTAYGMAHMPSFSMDYRELLDGKSWSSFFYNKVKTREDAWVNEHKELFELLPEDDFVRFKNGQDIWISNEVLERYAQQKEDAKELAVEKAQIELERCENEKCECVSPCTDCECDAIEKEIELPAVEKEIQVVEEEIELPAATTTKKPIF